LALILLKGSALSQDYALEWPESILEPGRAGLVLVVDKGAQELRIYRSDGQGNLILEKVVPCSTGMIKGDKLIRGDKKTPEGYYIFRQKLLPEELPAIYGILAYPMDYPNFWDKRLGRGGDGIWTHGINKPLVDFDSEGCVELFNHDLAALEDSIQLYDTPILVVERLRLVPVAEQKELAKAARRFVETWRVSWANKNLTAYRRLYDPAFINSENRSLEGWMDHKKRIFESYKRISVEVEDLRIFWHRDVLVATFIQRYQGDNRFQSVGRKRLYLAKNGPSFSILAEEFDNLPSPGPNKKLSTDQKMAALTTPPLALASVTSPVAVASAGAVTPVAPDRPVVVASATEAANEESARAALEAGAKSRTAVPPIVDDGPENGAGKNQDGATPTVVVKLKPEIEPAAGSAPENGAVSPVEPVKAAPPVSPVEPVKAATPASPVEPVKAVEPPKKTPPPKERSPEERPTEERLKLTLNGWLAAWNARDQAGYFDFYAEDFYFPERKIHLKSFKKYRGRLMTATKNLKVTAKDVKVKIAANEAQITFTQDYVSDSVKDRGQKTLVLKPRKGRWRIVLETFKARP
jgi:murein L,D-transpeptidase YafK